MQASDVSNDIAIAGPVIASLIWILIQVAKALPFANLETVNGKSFLPAVAIVLGIVSTFLVYGQMGIDANPFSFVVQGIINGAAAVGIHESQKATRVFVSSLASTKE